MITSRASRYFQFSDYSS